MRRQPLTEAQIAALFDPLTSAQPVHASSKMSYTQSTFV
jgi:hypothetical protein